MFLALRSYPYWDWTSGNKSLPMHIWELSALNKITYMPSDKSINILLSANLIIITSWWTLTIPHLKKYRGTEKDNICNQNKLGFFIIRSVAKKYQTWIFNVFILKSKIYMKMRAKLSNLYNKETYYLGEVRGIMVFVVESRPRQLYLLDLYLEISIQLFYFRFLCPNCSVDHLVVCAVSDRCS